MQPNHMATMLTGQSVLKVNSEVKSIVRVFTPYNLPYKPLSLCTQTAGQDQCWAQHYNPRRVKAMTGVVEEPGSSL